MTDFVYHNENPEKEHKSDCVSRAITFVSGLDYSTVRKMLFHSSRLMKCAKLSCNCYSWLLENVLHYKPIDCFGLTVGEFAKKLPYGTYLVRVPSHLTAVKDGKIYDTFDCGDDICDIAWCVK